MDWGVLKSSGRFLHYAAAFIRLGSNSNEMECVHIANGHNKVSVAIESNIGNGAKYMTVANNMGNGVNNFSVTNVDAPARRPPRSQ